MVVSPYWRLNRVTSLHNYGNRIWVLAKGVNWWVVCLEVWVFRDLWACIVFFFFFFFFYFFLGSYWLWIQVYTFFLYVCHVLHITKLKNLCSRKHEFVWDKEVWWFFRVQVSICRSKNLIGVNLAYNEHLPLLWFYMHLLTL